jgi:WhiB family redox-sensing transcriptional regulator
MSHRQHAPSQWSPGAAGPVLSLFDELTDTEGWRDRALCAETWPDAFFPEKGESATPAKRVCRACPVQAQCLEFALGNDERTGVWGGLSERERRRLKARRQQDDGTIPAAA